MKDTILLFSGGLDSTVLLWSERARVKAALFAEYGQPAEREEAVATALITERLRLPLCSIRVSMMGMEAMQDSSGAAGARIVPARNLVLLSHAVNLALAEGCSRVIYGATGGDIGAYADCRPAFVDALAALCASLGCTVEAPLIGMSKADVVTLGRSLGAPLDLSWSCYAPHFGRPCGGCNACLERIAALG